MRIRGGFTLIEILVVLIVLAVLLAVLLPSFKGTRKRAFDAAAESFLREAVGAQVNYASDEGAFATDPEELYEKGLRKRPGINLVIREGGNTFCMFARHRFGRRWFMATPEGISATDVPASEPAPDTCP